MIKSKILGGVGLGSIILPLMFPAIAQAQKALPETPASSEQGSANAAGGSGGVEDIVVTAQRISERLQDVPIAITALTSTALNERGVDSSLELETAVPGLQVSRSQQSLSPYIRGIGTQYASIPGLEAPVSLYVDGIYYPDNAGNVLSLSNIERIEVLKGPQGTLFGRNSTGGAISVTTRDPQAEPSLEAGLSYGNYDTLEGKLYVTGGSGAVAADLALYGLRQGDGFGTNVFTGRDQDVQKTFSARSKIAWEASPDDKLTLALEYGRDKTNLGLGVTAAPGTFLLDGLPGERPNDSRGNGFPPLFDMTSYTASLKYEHSFDWGSFSSLSAYRQVKNRYAWDVDGTPASILAADSHFATKSFQQEFLLSGKTDRLRWTGGLFFFYSDASAMTTIVSAAIPAANTTKSGQQITTSYAAFAQATYDFSDKTSLTGGFRYTIDNRQLNGTILASAGNAAPVGTLLGTELADNQASFGSPSWRLTLDHKLTPDVMIYARYDRGFKSGVFNTSVIAAPPIRPEKLDAFEVGLKSEFFDNTLRFNASLFTYKYKNIQIGMVNSSGFSQVINAASAKIKGADVELNYAPRLDFGDLSLSVAASYLDAKYDSFPNGPFNTVRPTGGIAQTSADLSGYTMAHAPKWTVNLTGSYSIPVGDNKLGVSASYFHSEHFSWEPDNNFIEPARDIVNAQAYFAFGDDDQYRIRVYGKNLLNTHYGTSGFSISVGNMYGYAPPRTYGVGFDVKF